MEIEVRIIKPEEYTLANDLYNRINGAGKRPFPFFEWEFLNGPFGPAIYIVALDLHKEGNPIIGTQSVIPIKLVNGNGDVVLSGKSEDTLLDPAYRGLGLFDKMYKVLFDACEEAGMHCIWGFTYAKKPFVRLGFEIPVTSQQGLISLNVIGAYNYFSSLNKGNSIWDKLKILALSCYSRLYSLKSVFKSNNKFAKVLSIMDDKLDLIVGNLTDHDYQILQDKNYINWRILRNPYSNSYHEITFFDLNKPVANVTFNIRPENFAYICQVIFTAELLAKEKILIIRETVKEIKKFKPVAIRFWGFDLNITNAEEIKIFKKAGFVFVSKGTAFVFKSLKNGILEPKQIVLNRIFTQGNY